MHNALVTHDAYEPPEQPEYGRIGTVLRFFERLAKGLSGAITGGMTQPPGR